MIVAAIAGALGVVAGAYGAHGLDAPPDKIASWNTAASYHLLHAVVLAALALFAHATEKNIALPATLLAVGIGLFSGSIYALVLGGPRALGPVTPLGGLCLAAGWLSLVSLRN